MTDARTVRRVLGWEAGSVLCPLPGHGGFAELERERGELVLDCDCLGRAPQWDEDGPRPVFAYGLADVFHAVRAGKVLGRGDRLSKGSRFVWRLLLAHEADLLVPVAVDLPPLPAGADDLHRRARGFFALLAGLRLRVGSELEMPFPDRLVAAWLGVERDEARAAIDAMCAAEVVVVTGRAGGPRGAYLFLPWRPGLRALSEEAGRAHGGLDAAALGLLRTLSDRRAISVAVCGRHVVDVAELRASVEAREPARSPAWLSAGLSSRPECAHLARCASKTSSGTSYRARAR